MLLILRNHSLKANFSKNLFKKEGKKKGGGGERPQSTAFFLKHVSVLVAGDKISAAPFF